MKFDFFKRWKFWKRLMLLGILLPILLFGISIVIVNQAQGDLIQQEIDVLNNTHKGLIEVGNTNIDPFKNFPYVSVKVDSVQLYESKKEQASLILDVADIYVGFNLWDIVNGNYKVQKLLIEDGFFNIIRHKDGSINIENAMAAPSEKVVEEKPIDIHLKDIELKNVDIHKLDEGNNLDIETYIYWAKSRIKTFENKVEAHVDSEFELNIIEGQDTSFIKHKHFEFHTDVLFDNLSGLLEIAPSGIKMENGDFKIQGSVETKKDMAMDLHINGTKPNFDMLIAFAPEDLIPTLESYNNAGEFYFNADVVGSTANGAMPFIDITFGANEAYLENVDVRKKVDNLGFKGHFTNGQEKSFESMEFSIEDFRSKLEEGNFIASLIVKNFVEPDVDLELNTDFKLEFLTQFFNVSNIENVSGRVTLDMHFHDIIDLDHPEKALNQLNQAYYSELNIEGLHLESPDLSAPIDNLDLHLAMNGKEGVLDLFELTMGATDLSLKGSVTNLPAIVHHTDIPVDAELEISSTLLDLAELTGFSKGDSTGIDEQIQNFSLQLMMNSSAKAFTESNYLPEGEFLIKGLHAQLKHFPHQLHDFHGKFIIDSTHLKIDEFTGHIDRSDFHLNGDIQNYGALMEDSLPGNHHANIPIEANLNMTSDLIDIAELTGISIGDSTGIDEQIEDFSIQMKFSSTAQGLREYEYLPRGEFFIEGLHAQLKHYPHELHDFNADILIDDKDLEIIDFTGYIDKSDFHFNGNIHDYGFWMKDTLQGDVTLDISLNADLLKLEDIFSYQGENYVPEDYRHEKFENLKLHVNGEMHYKDHGLHSIDVDLDQFDAKMNVHPMRFENFSGRFHYEDEHLIVEKMHGEIGRTIFDMDMNYYLGEDESIKLRDNHFGLKANYIDFNQLFAFNATPSKKSNTANAQTPMTKDVESHSSAFNIYKLPFTDMTFDIDVDHFIYHHIDLQNIQSSLRMTHDHYIYVDTINLQAAGGQFAMSGYFNGSDPENIYLKPTLNIIKADVDKLLFKYENFGQDEMISEYIHGLLSADITGNIRLYPDMIPDIDQSEIHMDVELLDGRLENYEPVLMLSEYMEDKNLSSIRFDTLQNHMDIVNGTITIPEMIIESTIGHYELSGEQTMDGDLEYYVRIPLDIIKQGTRNKLFGSKKTTTEEIGDDEIIEEDPKKKTRYLNLRIKGTLDDYDIELRKKRSQ